MQLNRNGIDMIHGTASLVDSSRSFHIGQVVNYPRLAECYKVAAFSGLNKLVTFEEQIWQGQSEYSLLST